MSDREEFPALKSLEFPEDPDQLRADALAELDAVGGRSFQAPPYEEAGDATNSVRVAVDRTGVVVDVHFRSDWATELTSSQLGAALLEAHRNAGAAMLNDLALAELARQERVKAAGGAEPEEPRPLPEVPERDIWEIWQQLSEAEDLLYRATKADRAAPGREVRTIQSMWGLMTAVCEGREITSIAVEPRMAQESGPERLRSAAMELFQLAGQPNGEG
jgi:hypothetical protein